MKKITNTIIEHDEDQCKNNCFIKITYFINKEKRTVACKLEPYAGQLSFLSFSPSSSSFAEELSIDYFENCDEDGTSYIGKAVCMPEDTFDVDFGKKLAYDRAMVKLFRDKKRFYRFFIEQMQKNIVSIEDSIGKITISEEKLNNRIEKKVKEA